MIHIVRGFGLRSPLLPLHLLIIANIIFLAGTSFYVYKLGRLSVVIDRILDYMERPQNEIERRS